jgi:hypothetical protein
MMIDNIIAFGHKHPGNYFIYRLIIVEIVNQNILHINISEVKEKFAKQFRKFDKLYSEEYY